MYISIINEDDCIEVLWENESVLDSAYIGLQKLAHKNGYPRYICKKNRKIVKLSTDDKDMNRLISKFRVWIEQTIGHIKRYDIVSDKFRHKLSWNYRTVNMNLKHQVMVLCCWLQNLHKLLD